MIIGYSVQGSSDRALLKGLQERWCPNARMVEGLFRGSTKESRRREIHKILVELKAKRADLVIFLDDSDGQPWRTRKRKDMERCPEDSVSLTVFGVCDRNVECWLSADRDFIANWFGRESAVFSVEDPKGIVSSCFGIGRDKMEEKIARFVCGAPLRHWYRNSESFRDFYEQVWLQSKRMQCAVENLR